LSVVLDRLREQDLDRAHIITAFFWAGLGSGSRLRTYFDCIPEAERGTALALVEMFGLQRDDPFCVGFEYGWRFGKDDDGEHES
jgi:hypothetical protein